MKNHLLASVGLMALMAGSSAHAADVNLKPVAPAAVWNWSGLYIGGHIGYGWGRDPQTDDVFGSKTTQIGDIFSRGSVWGFQAGANWQSGSWVGGLEIDLSGTGITGSSSASAVITDPPNLVTFSETQRDKFDMLGSARARLGFLPVPSLMIYGTAGPAWTRLSQGGDEAVSVIESDGAVVGSGTFSSPSWRFGIAAGTGIEARLGDSDWLGRVEYLHYDFGNSGASSSFTSGALTADVVRAGVSYKFTQGRTVSGYAGAMPVKAVPVAPWTWSGFYLGAHAGYGWGRDPTEDTDFGTISSKGFVAGFQGGANWQSGAVVGGLEIDVSGTSIKGSGANDGDTQTDKFDWLNSARARLGYLVLPGTMLYGTGGLAWTRFVQTSGPDISPSWEFGWVAGAGIETRLGATNWLGRVEYLHYDFGDSGSFFDSSGSFSSGHLTADVVRGGVSYKLDWSGAGPVGVSMPLKAQPAAAWSWDGFYIGGHGGYGWGRDPHNDAVFGSKFQEEVVAQSDVNSQGFVAGFQAGANWQMGNWVAGLETDLSFTGIKGSATNPGSGPSEIVTEIDTEKFDTLGSARARLGYLAWPNMLFYGTGGAAWARINLSETDFNTDSTVSGSSSPAWRFGWVAGVGGETRLLDSNWLLRLEYLHYDFGDSGNSSANFTGFGSSADESTSESLNSGHLTVDVVRGGLSYKFR